MKIIVNPELYKDKEALYINVRSVEGRVINNDTLLSLPNIAADSPYKKEWDIRAANYHALVKYLKNSFKNQPIHILDIGCGNGWMSNRLSREGYSVTGLDLNMIELKQAEEVFGENENLHWVYADVLQNSIAGKYDIILFSASCQYFPDLMQLTSRLQPLLNNKGEIHFHDSVFYKDSELGNAQKRSLDYYTQLGYPQMASYYFHHSKNVLKQLGYKSLNHTGLFQKKPVLEWWMKKVTN